MASKWPLHFLFYIERHERRFQFCILLSSQQAFNATAVIRHMRRLQLGSSMDSSQHRKQNPTSMPGKSQSVDVSSDPRNDCKFLPKHFMKLTRLLLNNLSYSSAGVCCVLYYVVLSNSPWGGCYLCLGSSMQAANSSSTTPERHTRPSTVTTIITGSKWHHFLSDCPLTCCTLWKDVFSPM